MSKIAIKPPLILLSICFSIGAAVDYFTEIHWLPVGLAVLFAFLVNGLAISIEGNEPGGFDHDQNANPEAKKRFNNAVRIQAIIIVIVFALGIASYVYTSS